MKSTSYNATGASVSDVQPLAEDRDSGLSAQHASAVPERQTPIPQSPVTEGDIGELTASEWAELEECLTPAMFTSLKAALQALAPKPVEGDIGKLIGGLWQDLLDKDDRTSPEEYPDMALITFGEFKQAIQSASLQPQTEPHGDIGELKPTHEQMMAGYAVACRYGIYEVRAFNLAEAMFKAMAAQALQALEQRAQKAESERDEARAIVALANNSVFGSWGYFTEASGKTLAEAIEDLKAYSRGQYARAEAAEQKVKELITSLDLPPERDRTDEQRKDIQRAWDLIQHLRPGHLLDSTEGHLALVRAIQLGRRLASHSTVEQMAKALEEIAKHPEQENSKDGSYGVGWAFHNVQSIARSALSLKKENAR